MSRGHPKKMPKHPKHIESTRAKSDDHLPKSHFSLHSSVKQNQTSVFRPSNRSSVITSPGRYVILTRSSGLGDLSRHSLKNLTALLKMHPGQFIDQPRRDWLMDQKTAIESLHRSLQRPSNIVTRAAIRGGTYQAPFCPGVANLCRWHAGLDPRMIRNLARLLVKECTSRAHLIRDTREEMTHAPQVRTWLSRMDGMAALWMSEEDLEGRLGYKPRRAMVLQRAECEACICAAVGGSPGRLADLKAGILAREESHGSKRRRPRLLRIVESWIESHDETVRSSIHQAANNLVPLLSDATTRAIRRMGTHHESDCDGLGKCEKRVDNSRRHKHRNRRADRASGSHARVPADRRRASILDGNMANDRDERFANMERHERPNKEENPRSNAHPASPTYPRADRFDSDLSGETLHAEYVEYAGENQPKVILPDNRIPEPSKSAHRETEAECPPGMTMFTAPSAVPFPLHIEKDASPPPIPPITIGVNQDEGANPETSWVTDTVHSHAPSTALSISTRYTQYMNEQFPGLSALKKQHQQPRHPGNRLLPPSADRRRVPPPPSSVYSLSPGGVRPPTVVTEALCYASKGHMRDHVDRNPKHLHLETLRKLEHGTPLTEWETQQVAVAGWI